MKIVILTLGTRGDVQPYVALSQALIKRNHSVKICTGESFKNFVEEHGIDFHKASIDFMELLKTEAGQAIFNGGKMKLKEIMAFTKSVVNPLFRKTFDDFLQAAADADLLIYHPKALAAVDVAEYYNIPCICCPPVPMVYPIKEFPSLAVSPNKNFGPWINKMTYKLAKFGESSSMKDINAFRVKHHMSKRKMGAYTFKYQSKDLPILYPISPSLFDDVSSWDNHVTLTGFFYMDIEAQLDETLLDFIHSGQKPIIISFSSMPLSDPEAFKNILIRALEETNNRAVVLTGNSGLSFEDCPWIYPIEKAPHRLLFPLGKGLVHHGGVGTLAEALRSGVPQLIMPFNVDQPFWAHRMYQGHLALKPLREKDLSLKALIDRLNTFNDPATILSAQSIQKKILSENGLEAAVNYIERR